MHDTTLRRVAQFVIFGVWLGIAQASAEPIHITGGSLDMTAPAGDFAITGERGFSYVARAFVQNGVWAPYSSGCYFLCAEGPVSLAAVWSGHDFSGTATLDGRTYTNVGSLSGITSMFAQFSGTVDVPAPGASPLTVVTPFTFSGFFHHGPTEQLFGSGWATVMLTPTSWEGRPLWAMERVRYDFSPDPIPEPATVLLVGGAVAALGARRWRSRRPR
jgi:hypothetical protein